MTPATSTRRPAGGETRLFDAGYPEHEQLPHVMRVRITSRNGHANTTINGTSFGDRLTDNSWHDDGYRFHDVFHIAHATYPGLSPSLRGLLRRKRKSDPMVDEVEDGGRAIVIEEGLTAFVFAYAEAQNFFEGHAGMQSPGDATLIRAIRLMTQHLEVGIRNFEDWEEAILQGYNIWRTIRNEKGGAFTAALRARTITLER